jgi:hypothetical protein
MTLVAERLRAFLRVLKFLMFFDAPVTVRSGAFLIGGDRFPVFGYRRGFPLLSDARGRHGSLNVGFLLRDVVSNTNPGRRSLRFP